MTTVGSIASELQIPVICQFDISYGILEIPCIDDLGKFTEESHIMRKIKNTYLCAIFSKR